MWQIPQFTFTEEIVNGKLHFLYSDGMRLCIKVLPQAQNKSLIPHLKTS